MNPEIITFDELYERAKFIVRHSETEKPFSSEDNQVIYDEGEIPF